MKYFFTRLLATAVIIHAFFYAAPPSHARQGEDSRTLIMALLPIPDALPSYIAKERGYFKEYGIRVKAISVASALERDQLMQAGRIDGMINELAGTASFNRDKIRMQIVASARTPLKGSPLFRVLSAPQSGILNVSQLKDVPIGVSRNTVIEYITDRLLTRHLSPDQIKKRSVPVLPERMQLLLSGQIRAATLPDPLGASAIRAGAIPVTDDLIMPHRSVSVLSFSIKALEKKEETVSLYLKAWMRAAGDLNKDPEAYRDLMLKKIRVPENIRNDFKIPAFPVDEIPSEDQWKDVMVWMKGKGLIKTPPAYGESVNGKFLK